MPVTADDDAGMEADADSGSDEAGSMENEDIAEGIPVQGSTTGGVDPKSPAVTSSHGQSQAVSHSQSPQESSTVTAKVMEESPTVMVNESREESSTVIGKDARKTQLPKAILTVKSEGTYEDS